MLRRTIIQDDKIYYGEQELANLINVLIRAYRFKCKNQDPKMIVIPIISEVAGIKVEYMGGSSGKEEAKPVSEVKPTKRGTGKSGN